MSKIGKSEHATLYQSERPAKNEIILAIHPASLFPCFTESQEPGHKGPAFAGKQPLWRVLSCANFPAFRDVDLIALEQRAVKQQERLERQRMQTACEVFGTN